MPVLRQGSSGPDVTNLQQKLKDLGFDPNGVDGHFGPGTRDAVMAFSKAKGCRLTASRDRRRWLRLTGPALTRTTAAAGRLAMRQSEAPLGRRAMMIQLTLRLRALWPATQAAH